jgi:Fe-S-cluster containining protein
MASGKKKEAGDNMNDEQDSTYAPQWIKRFENPWWMLETVHSSFAVCKRCKGKCCGRTFLTVNEAKQIETETGKPCLTEDHGTLLRLKSNNGACPYLSDTGCTLKHKPIACILYPFLPTKRGWVIRMSCPHWREITDDEFEQVKKVLAHSREWIGCEAKNE